MIGEFIDIWEAVIRICRLLEGESDVKAYLLKLNLNSRLEVYGDI